MGDGSGFAVLFSAAVGVAQRGTPFEPVFFFEFETSLDFQVVLIVERKVIQLVFSLFHDLLSFEGLGLKGFQSEFQTLVLLEEETVVRVVGHRGRLVPQGVGL